MSYSYAGIKMKRVEKKISINKMFMPLFAVVKVLLK